VHVYTCIRNSLLPIKLTGLSRLELARGVAFVPFVFPQVICADKTAEYGAIAVAFPHGDDARAGFTLAVFDSAITGGFARFER